MHCEPKGPLLADEILFTNKRDMAGDSPSGLGAPYVQGFLEPESRVRWIVENGAAAGGIICYHNRWPNPMIRVKVPKNGLRKVTIGYQITCHFEESTWLPWSWFRNTRHESPKHEFKWISFNLERAESKRDDDLDKRAISAAPRPSLILRRSKDFLHYFRVSEDQIVMTLKDDLDIHIRWNDAIVDLLSQVNQKTIFDDGMDPYKRAVALVNCVSRHQNPDLVLALLNDIASRPSSAYILAEDWQGSDELCFQPLESSLTESY
jgi:hypothetical protein